MAEYTPDPENTSGDGEFSPLPPGVYKCYCIQADEKQTKAAQADPSGNTKGSYFNLRWEVLDEQFQGRLVFSMITWENQSDKAQDIGRQQLNSICKAANLGANGKVNLPEDLVNVEMYLRIGTKTFDGKKDNEVKAYLTEAPAAHTQRQAARAGRTAMGAPPVGVGRSKDDEEPPF